MNDFEQMFMQAIVMADLSSQIIIAIAGAFIWYVFQIFIEHYRLNTRICNKFDSSLKKFLAWFHDRKNEEYCNDLIDDISLENTTWKKLKVFLGSFFPKKPPSNIPDLKDSGTSGELEVKKQASTEEEEEAS